MDSTETPVARPKRRRWRCCWLGAVIAGSGLVLCAGGLSAVVYWLIPPYTWKGWVDNERKVPPKWAIEVPADNARDVYAEAFAMLPPWESEGPLVRGWADAVYAGDDAAIQRDLPRAKALVGQYQGALQQLHEGGGRRYLRGEPPSTAELTPILRGPRSAARLGACAAMVAHVEGRDDDALRTLEDVTLLGINFDSGEALIQFLVGAACVGIEHRAAAYVILHGHPSDAVLRAHVAFLERVRQRPQGIASSYAFEVESFAGAFRAISRGGILQSKTALEREGGESLPGPEIQAIALKSGSSRQWYHDRLARLIEEVSKPAATRDLAAFDARTKQDAAARSDFTADVVTVMPRAATKYFSMHAQLAAEEVMCALELYRREHGAYPADLSALAPVYLPALPEDPFSGDPLLYRVEAEGYTLYAVGPNKVDDGGVSAKPRTFEPDQVFVGGRYLSE
jgi:hypothetical protein